MSDYSGGIGIASVKLVVAVVLEVSPMVLIEALEAVVEVDGSTERGIDSECDPAWGAGSVIGLVFAGNAGIIVAKINLLGSWGGFDED